MQQRHLVDIFALFQRALHHHYSDIVSRGCLLPCYYLLIRILSLWLQLTKYFYNSLHQFFLQTAIFAEIY